MRRKLVQTEFEPAEYRMFVRVARKNGLTIKEALREAVLRWNQVESRISASEKYRSTKTRKRVKAAAQADKRIARSLKTGDKELKKRHYKVASGPEDVDKILC
jgi:hypothetical protein